MMLLKRADYVSLHIPFIKEQGATIGKDQLRYDEGWIILN